MIARVRRPVTTTFSLPAERTAYSVLLRFVREYAAATVLTDAEIEHLQSCVQSAFFDALKHQETPGEGRVAVKIVIKRDEMRVDLSYRETHFPPADVFSRS